MLPDEIEAFTHQSVDLQKLSWDEDCHGVLVVEFGATVLLDG